MTLTNCLTNHCIAYEKSHSKEWLFSFYIYHMDIKRYSDFAFESRFNPVSREIRRFKGMDMDIMHKVIHDNSGVGYGLWHSGDPESMKALRRYVGKYAIDLGGYSTSRSDIFMYLQDCFSAVIKTNKDDIVPDEVIRGAAAYLIKRYSVNPGSTIFFVNKDFVGTGGVSEDDFHLGRVTYLDGIITIKRM